MVNETYSFRYEWTDVPPGMTLTEYARLRAGRREQRPIRRVLASLAALAMGARG